MFEASLIETDPVKCVEDAAKWSGALWNKTYLGMGDTQEAAMHRTAATYGVDPGTLWALRYRKPKGILAHVYARLKAAYFAECERQEAKLRHELELARTLQGSASVAAAIREAEAALGVAQIDTADEFADFSD